MSKTKYNVLMIDCSEQHRQVVRHFLNKIHPAVTLVEIDPCQDGLPDDTIIWSNYMLLIIDNMLGKQDGMEYVRNYIKEAEFPPVIFLSSIGQPGSTAATQQVIEAIRMGAETFLFKKDIDVKQFNQTLTSVLERQGYDQDITLPSTATIPGHVQRPSDIPSASSGVTQVINHVMQDTVHEMELAMAMIHGHAEWPFSMMDILTGKAHIANYKVMSYLGKGDNTTTFKGRSLKDSQEVIIKLIGKSVDRQSEGYRQCIKQLTQASQWKHPNLAHLLEFTEENDQLVVVQEFIQGEKLSSFMKRMGRPPDDLIYEVMAGMLKALIKLHEHKLVVENISPHNIMFRDERTPAFTNYGIIRRLHALTQATGQTGLGAEAAYVSPEKITKRHTDIRTDIYMMGAIFYELIAGFPPFYKGSVQDILYAHLSQPVPPLPDAKHPMNRVIHEMMQKTPSKRIQKTVEVLEAVDKIYAG